MKSAPNDTNSPLQETPEGHVRTPFGVSLLNESMRSITSWRGALAKQERLPELTPAERIMFLRAQKIQLEITLRTLRQTVVGEDTQRYMLERPLKDEIPHIVEPTAEEMAQHGKLSLDEQLSRHPSIVALTGKTGRLMKHRFGQETSRVARLKALQSDACEEVDENISHMAHLAKHYAAAIHHADEPGEQEYACVVMEEMMAVAARTIVLMKQQTHPNDPDRTVNAIHTVVDAVNELVNHALLDESQRLPDHVSRNHYYDLAHGIMDLFFGKQANRMAI